MNKPLGGGHCKFGLEDAKSIGYAFSVCLTNYKMLVRCQEPVSCHPRKDRKSTV